MGVLLAGNVGMWGAGPAAAAGLTLQYTCSLPPFPAQAMTAHLTWNTPDSVPVGQTTPVLPVNATATMGAAVTQGLGLIGAATVEGTADASGAVVAPEGDFNATVPLTVPRSDVPASGPITVAANGTTPVFAFHRPGRATVTIGSRLALHLIPKNASGGPAAMGAVDASCTLDPGQNDVLSTFEITAAGTAPVPTAGGPAGPTRHGTAAATAPGTPGAAATGTATASAPALSRTTAASLTSGASGPTRQSATITPDSAVTVASTTGLAAVDPRLVGGGILAACAAAFGC
ncbi:MAG TPA: DUF6801 domain-containing protein, partial [Pseudonocardiaceae bacterium]